jgi:hypothetical protein
MTTHIVAACARRPWLVILVAAALGASAFWYNVGHIAIDTDSAKLIGEDLAWRKRERVFDAAFPQRADLIAVVVDGATPELAEEATKTLAVRLSRQPGMYRAVWRPDGGLRDARRATHTSLIAIGDMRHTGRLQVATEVRMRFPVSGAPAFPPIARR